VLACPTSLLYCRLSNNCQHSTAEKLCVPLSCSVQRILCAPATFVVGTTFQVAIKLKAGHFFTKTTGSQGPSCSLAGPTEDDEPFVHSFYDDVAQNPHIVRAMLAVTHGIQKSVSGLSRVIDGWKVHQPLWKLDKGTVLDKFKVRFASPLVSLSQPTCYCGCCRVLLVCW